MDDHKSELEKRIGKLEDKLNKIFEIVKRIETQINVSNPQLRQKSNASGTTAYETRQINKRWEKERHKKLIMKIPKPKNQAIKNFRGAEIYESEIGVLKKFESICRQDFEFLKGKEHNPNMTFRVSRKRVIFLGLNNTSLSKLPEEISKLNALQIIVLSNNNLTNLPDSIGKISYLTELYLENNKLSSLPQNIVGLQKLEYLNLDNNKIEDLPDNLGSLKSLKIFRINNNKLEEIPESMGQLRNLQELYMNNNILQKLPDTLANLVNLEEFSITDNHLSELPNSLYELPYLSFLNLTNNDLTSLSPKLKNLPHLQILRLQGNPLEKPDEKKIEKLLDDLRNSGIKV